MLPYVCLSHSPPSSDWKTFRFYAIVTAMKHRPSLQQSVGQLARVVLLTCALLPLGGCLYAAAATAAGGSWWATKEYTEGKHREREYFKKQGREQVEEEFKQRQAQLQKRSGDEQAEYELVRALLGGGLTKVIAVQTSVSGGIVTLYGNVPSQVVADRAVEVARSVPGVSQVNSRLMVVQMDIAPPAPQRFVPRNQPPQGWQPPGSAPPRGNVIRVPYGQQPPPGAVRVPGQPPGGNIRQPTPAPAPPAGFQGNPQELEWRNPVHLPPANRGQ